MRNSQSVNSRSYRRHFLSKSAPSYREKSNPRSEQRSKRLKPRFVSTTSKIFLYALMPINEFGNVLHVRRSVLDLKKGLNVKLEPLVEFLKELFRSKGVHVRGPRFP